MARCHKWVQPNKFVLYPTLKTVASPLHTHSIIHAMVKNSERKWTKDSDINTIATYSLGKQSTSDRSRMEEMKKNCLRTRIFYYTIRRFITRIVESTTATIRPTWTTYEH